MFLTKLISILALTASCVALSGCGAPPQILVSQDFVGERSVQYLMQKTGTSGTKKNKVQLFNFSTRICSVTKEGQQTDCVNTLILENIKAKPIY